MAFFFETNEIVGPKVKDDLTATFHLPIAALTYDFGVTGTKHKFAPIEGLLTTPDRAVKTETLVNKEKVALSKLHEAECELQAKKEELKTIYISIAMIFGVGLIALLLAAVFGLPIRPQAQPAEKIVYLQPSPTTERIVHLPCKQPIEPTHTQPQFTTTTLNILKNQAQDKLQDRHFSELLKFFSNDLNLASHRTVFALLILKPA